MNILDYIIIGFAALCFVLGLLRGFWRGLLSIAGIVAIVYFTSLLTPVVSGWFGDKLPEGTRVLIAMGVTLVVLGAAWGVASWLIGKLFKLIPFPKILSRILGAILGVVSAYMIVAILFAIIYNTGEEFLASVKAWEPFSTTWFGTKVYANNFFGDWVIGKITALLVA